MEYSYCISCGEHKDYGKDIRITTCRACGYDELTELDQDDWNEHLERQKEYHEEEEFKNVVNT